MQKHTRIAFNAYLGQQAKINEVDSATVTYTVAATPAQKLEKAIRNPAHSLRKSTSSGSMSLKAKPSCLGSMAQPPGAPRPTLPPE